MAREVMVPRTDAFMIDIEDNTQENIQAILKKFLSYSLFTKMTRIRSSIVIHTKAFLKQVSNLVSKISNFVES